MHLKNPLRSRIGRVLLAGGFLILLASVQSKASKQRRPPESGFSDQYVRSLGREAEAFLVSKLGDPKEEKHHEGIVRQLERFMEIGHEEPKTTNGLINFIDTQVGRGEIGPSTLFAVEDALRVLGYRGGKVGLDYLASWLTGTKPVTAYLPASKAPFTIYRIKRAAVRAIGLSERNEAAARLNEFRASLQPGEEAEVYLRDITEALKERERVKKTGLEKILKERKLR